jgi:DNA-binding NarL/FixJ family response regulator
MIRVLLADDQELVREGFRMILDAQEEIQVVGEAADGAEAVTLARELRPDVILMDVRMPGTDGITATRRLLHPGDTKTRVLILTTFDLDEYVYEAMKAGASGFLLKDVPRSQLIEGVRTIARGDALLSPTITRRLVEEFVRRPRPDDVPSDLVELTERELEVMRMVARGLSNAEIAAQLHLSEATVKTHVAHILQKLDLRDRVQVVVLAYESGLAQPGS